MEPGKVLRRLPFGLEQGIYLQSEAVLFTGLPRTTVWRWLQLERGYGGLRELARQPLVSFLDLISLRAVAALRRLGLRLGKIREGAELMRGELGIDYPLASETLKTDGVSLFFCRGPQLLAVDAAGQVAAQELVNDQLRDVVYRQLAGNKRLATSWEPPGVIIDPHVQRGAPCVAGSRVQIALLKKYADAGDSAGLLAELFELDPSAVRAALCWYEGLKPTPRAA